MTKEENSAPTVSIYAVLLSCVIDEIENRDVFLLIYLGLSCRWR